MEPALFNGAVPEEQTSSGVWYQPVEDTTTSSTAIVVCCSMSTALPPAMGPTSSNGAVPEERTSNGSSSFFNRECAPERQWSVIGSRRRGRRCCAPLLPVGLYQR